MHAAYEEPTGSSNNTVTVEDGSYTVNGTTYTYTDYFGSSEETTTAGNSTTSNSENNIFNFNGGIVNAYSIMAGRTTYGNGIASGNILNIGDGVTFSSHGFFGGNSLYNTAQNNEVNIYGSNIDITYIYGAYGHINSVGNTVNISGGTINASAYIMGGDAGKNGHSYNNEVNISGGIITASRITGGMCEGEVNNNTVNISGGTITSTIYGGVSSAGNDYDNTINISGSPDLSGSYLYGGGTSNNHTLNIYTKDITAKNIGNFSNINFYLPESTVKGDTILTLSENSTNISGATVNAGVAGNANLNNGDVITLMTNNGTITTDGTTYGKLTEGVSLTYDLTVSKDGDNKIVATIGSVSDSGDSGSTSSDDDSNDNTDSGGSSDGGTFNKKMEIIDKHFIPPMPEPPPLPEPNFDFEEEGLDGFFKENESSWEVFGDMGAGPMRYKVNNGHIDTTNQNADLGLARKLSGDSHLMTIAPIIDYQNTNYDSYLNDGTRARGNSKYTGGGFVLRNMNKNGFYFETSLRGGRTKTDFASEDLDTTGNFGTITYDTSQTIWNGHLKLGKYLRLNKNNLLHVYGFYYHTHQGGSNADLSSGEHYNFSSANAGRARIGYRMTTRTSKISQIYTGLAYQFEHNSGVKASYKACSTSGESHNGSSGMLELGWIIKPLKDNPWAVDINATGWIGNQRGVKAMAKISKSF